VSIRITVLDDLILGGGMADIIHRHIIMLASEERHRGVALAPAEHVACRGLALPLGDNPVFDAQPLAAA